MMDHFLSHTINTLIDLESNDQNSNHNNNNNNVDNHATDNTHVYQNHAHRKLTQTVNSTELTQISDPLNATLTIIPNVNTTLPRLHRQNSVHFNNEPINISNSTQPTLAIIQNTQITPQQIVNIVRQLNSQSTQQTTNAPNPYYLQAVSTQTPLLVVRRNAQMMYPYLGGSIPMQQSLRPFDGTDPTYTTEVFLNAITANMVMTAEPEQTDSLYHEAWILKRTAMMQMALIGPAQQWYSHLPLEIKKNWQAFCRNFQKKFDNQQSQTPAKILLESLKRASGEQKKY